MNLRRILVASVVLTATLTVAGPPHRSDALAPTNGSVELISVSDDGRMAVFSNESLRAIRVDRLTGAEVVQAMATNWLVPSTSGRYLDDESGHWIDLDTGARIAVPEQITSADASGDVVLISSTTDGSLPRIDRRSTGEHLAFVSQAALLSPSGRFVVDYVEFTPVTRSVLLDLATGSRSTLPVDHMAYGVADDGTVLLVGVDTIAVNPLTGRRRALEIAVERPLFGRPNQPISRDGAVAVGRRGDRLVVQRLDNGVVADLGPWPAATLGAVVTSPPFLQPDGAAVVYSVSERSGSTWSTRLVDVPVPGRSSRRVKAGEIVPVDVAAPVPGGARAVALNVTVTDPVAAGYLTVFPCGVPVPLASNVNFVAGQTIPNVVVTGVDGGGRACLYASVDLDAVIDVQGAVAAGAPYTPVTPTRVLDTRAATGVPTTTRVAAGAAVRVRVAGVAGVPADAATAILNVTVTEPLGPGFVTVYPCTDQPTASNLNYRGGETIANAVVAPLDADGAVCVATSAEAHLVIDVGGTFPTTSSIVGRPPVRVLDTRIGTGVPTAGPIGADAVVRLDLAPLLVPGARVVALNVTAVDPSSAGFMTVWPCDAAPPLASNVNHEAGQTIPNLVLAATASDGSVCIYTKASSDIVVDLAAVITGDATYVGIVPRRVLDTRSLPVD